MHRRTDESFYVLDGELTVRVADQTVTAAAGTFLHVPKGVPHSVPFNRGTTPVRYLFLLTPGGLESYFVERAAAVEAAGGELDSDALDAVAAKHDLYPVAE